MCSAEMIECGLIAFYGYTNTFMERMGASADEPFSIHEIEHISIAVMFAFAGTLGILLESRRVRDLIGGPIGTRLQDARAPPSYAFGSYNPVPAFVVILTGIAMSAHHQT